LSKPTPLATLLALTFTCFILLTPFVSRSDDDTSDLQRAWQEYEYRSDRLTEFFVSHYCPALNDQLIPAYLDAAFRYNLDYRFLPAISIQESSCAKHYPPDSRNLWGWASARVGFESFQSGIDFVSSQLANGHYYAGKTLEGKLHSYNPEPSYAPKIIRLMEEIQP
jgi:hypothetical protein